MGVATSLKATVPVGVPVAGAMTATVAVNVTDWATSDGLGDAVTVIVVVAGTNSNAPISQPAPCGRAMPRWSVVMFGSHRPALIAGLPGSRAMVWVGPPLSASDPR